MRRVFWGAVLTVSSVLSWGCTHETTTIRTEDRTPGYQPGGGPRDDAADVPADAPPAVSPAAARTSTLVVELLADGRLNVRAEGAPAARVFSEIARVGGLNVMISEEVTDPVDATLTRITPGDAILQVGTIIGATVEEIGGAYSVRPGEVRVVREGSRYQMENLRYPVTVLPPGALEIASLSTLAIRDDLEPLDSAAAIRFAGELYQRDASAIQEIARQAGHDGFPGGRIPYLPTLVDARRVRVFRALVGDTIWAEVLLPATIDFEHQDLVHLVWQLRTPSLDVAEAWLFSVPTEP